MARPRKGRELEILSVDFELGIRGSGHTTHIKMWPHINRAMIWDEAVGLPKVVIGGEISIPELLEILHKLREEKRRQ